MFLYQNGSIIDFIEKQKQNIAKQSTIQILLYILEYFILVNILFFILNYKVNIPYILNELKIYIHQLITLF